MKTFPSASAAAESGENVDRVWAVQDVSAVSVDERAMARTNCSPPMPTTAWDSSSVGAAADRCHGGRRDRADLARDLPRQLARRQVHGVHGGGSLGNGDVAGDDGTRRAVGGRRAGCPGPPDLLKRGPDRPLGGRGVKGV